jgi:hypothetical protein
MAEPFITSATESVPKANVDAALEALGIHPDQFKVISQVTIDPNEVTIHAYAADDDGKFQTAYTAYGRTAVMGIHVYKIDKD